MFLELIQIQKSCLCYRGQAEAESPTKNRTNWSYQDFTVVVRKIKKKENKGPTGTFQRDEIRTLPLDRGGSHSHLAPSKDTGYLVSDVGSECPEHQTRLFWQGTVAHPLPLELTVSCLFFLFSLEQAFKLQLQQHKRMPKGEFTNLPQNIYYLFKENSLSNLGQ